MSQAPTGRAAAAARPDRHATIDALHRSHHQQLQRVVARRAGSDEQTIEDACSHAWAQLLSRPHVDLGPPAWRALAWLTTTAMHEAWRLHARRALPAAELHDQRRDETAPSAEDVVEQRDRLARLQELPVRPRRFLLRQVAGYSRAEISQLEGATATTTNPQRR